MNNPPRTVLFVILPYLAEYKEAKGNNTRSVLAFPYGILSIASYLKAHLSDNHRIRILDLNLCPSDRMLQVLRSELEALQPLIVGISMMFDTSYKYLHAVSRGIKDYSKKTTVVLGGAAATVSWDSVLQEQEYVDALCFTEGEYTMHKLVAADDLSLALDQDPAWVTRKKLSKNMKPVGCYVDNLNEVIPVHYEFIDVKSYSMKEAFSPFSSIRKHKDIRQFFLVTSRGCPFKCVFCAEPSFHGKGMRYADVDVLIDHVRFLKTKYGMNVLSIYDDQLLLNKPRAKEFFRRLADFKIRLETPNGLSVAFIDDEMAELMRGAGMDTVPLAIESGSERMLREVIHKPLRLAQVKPAVDALHRNGIFVQGYFVVGIPGEQEEDRDQTVRFIKDIGLDWSGFNLATPLRGSELYRICKEKGYIDPDYRIGDLGMHDYAIRVPGIDPAAIKKRRYLMNLDVNFVHNYRMRTGDYQLAALCFEDVIARYENHAFAYYYLAKAYEGMKESPDRVERNRERYNGIIATDAAWQEYAKIFNMETV